MLFLAAIGGSSVRGDDKTNPETFDSLMRAATAAYQDRQPEKAIEHANAAIQKSPSDPRGYMLKGLIYEQMRKHKESIAMFDRVIELKPDAEEVYDRRGSEKLAAGQVTEAIADFDRFIKLKPAAEPAHWKRGIAYYYAKRFDDGRKQFEAYQTFDNADVENAVWRFLCMAQSDGVEKARADLLKIGDDRRIPMRQIYDLFAGKATPKDVLEAVETGKPTERERHDRLFYAHQYLGLYYEATGNAAKAYEHTLLAAERFPIAHYMWDVARMHADRLKKPK